MKGASRMPQLNFRWPQKDIDEAKEWAESVGRSLNTEVNRIVMEYIKERKIAMQKQ
ncbi:Arc family DNA-binding protein [Providencia sp. R33]|uniref:Arc family DNA-binding protein n=1 Tax=Providencia sp. R33 TaxID=2828763 RepID=UPI001C5B7D03|nr:Arc family DNA-binding protein [Providencia sp. R33]